MAFVDYFRGAWSSTVADGTAQDPFGVMADYRLRNEVTHNDITYQYISSTAGSTEEPGTVTGSTVWRVVVHPAASWAEEGDTTQIPANKLGNAGSAGAGFLFGDDVPFAFSTNSDTFSTRTYTGIAVFGTSTYITFDNLTDGTMTTQPDFDQLRQILLGGHASGMLSHSHTFTMTPSGTSINVPAGTFVNTGQSTGGRGSIEFTFTGTNPFTGNIASQTGFTHIGAQSRIETLIAGRALDGDVNGSELTLDVNVPDNAVTSTSPPILVNYTGSDASLVQSALVTVIMAGEGDATRLVEHFGREAANGSVTVHETSILTIDPASGADTAFPLVIGDELRLTGLETNNRVTIDFNDTPGQTGDDAPQRAQAFATALGTADGRMTLAANTRVVHGIEDGTNTEIRRLTDAQNRITSNIAVDLEINQSNGSDASDGQVATYDGTTGSWVASAAPESSITVEDEGTALATAATTLNFVGAGVTAAGTGAEKTITIPGGGSGITVEDEGTALATEATTLNFAGAGVTATGTGSEKTITIPGGGSGVTVEDEGTALATVATTLNFTGTGVTASGTGSEKTINIPGNGGGGASGVPDFEESTPGRYNVNFAPLQFTVPDAAFSAAFNLTAFVGTSGSQSLAVTSADTLRSQMAAAIRLASQNRARVSVVGNVVSVYTNTPELFRFLASSGAAVDWSQVTTNIGTPTATATDIRITLTQTQIDDTIQWASDTGGGGDIPLWNLATSYVVGNDVIFDNRLFRANTAITGSTAPAQHFTSQEIQYFSTPDDNGVFSLRIRFFQAQTVNMGSYHLSFMDSVGNEYSLTFDGADVRNDDTDLIGVGNSNDHWLIQYSDISYDMNSATFPNSYTTYSASNANLNNGASAVDNPATDARWDEISPAGDVQIPDHTQFSAYRVGQIVTDPITENLYRCIDPVEAQTGVGNLLTDIRNARIVDDNGVVSLAIRFFQDENPRADASVTDSTVWTFHANIHSDGSAVSATFTSNAIIRDATSSNVLNFAQDEWFIRVGNLTTMGNFPTTVSNVSSVDFLDVSHASLHTGAGFNPRPGADSEHWERIGSDLPNRPTTNGDHTLRREIIPPGTFIPDTSQFGGGGDATVDAGGITRLGGGVVRLLVASTGTTTVSTGNVFFSTNSTADAGNFIATYRGSPTTDPEAAMSILFADGETEAATLRALAGTAGSMNQMLVYVDDTNWALFDVSDTAGLSNLSSLGTSAKTISHNMSMGSLAGRADIIFGDSTVDFLVGTTAPRVQYSWVAGDTGGYTRAIWEGVSPTRGPFTPPVGTRRDNVNTQNIAFAQTFSSNLSPTVGGNGIVSDLPIGNYLVSVVATFIHAGTTTVGANRSSINIDLQLGDSRSGSNTAWTTQAHGGGYVRGSEELPETTIVIKKVIQVTDNTNNDFRVVAYRLSTSDTLDVTLLGDGNSFIIDRI